MKSDFESAIYRNVLNRSSLSLMLLFPLLILRQFWFYSFEFHLPISHQLYQSWGTGPRTKSSSTKTVLRLYLNKSNPNPNSVPSYEFQVPLFVLSSPFSPPNASNVCNQHQHQRLWTIQVSQQSTRSLFYDSYVQLQLQVSSSLLTPSCFF